MAYVGKDAALMVKDANAEKELIDKLLELLNNDERQMQLGANIKKLGRPNAAKDIVDQVMELVK